jgi:hypothetical protein
MSTVSQPSMPGQRLLRRATLTALALALITACTANKPPDEPRTQSEPAEVVLRNGQVLTIDARFSRAQAVAIRGDRIVAVGSNAAVAALTGPRTQVIDLQGRTVMPGLIDAHLHSAGGGPGVALASVRSMDELLAAVKARAQVAKPGEIIVSNADWHEAQLREKRLPHRRELDTVAPNNPVVLVRGGHEYIVNSAALARWNITRDTPTPAGGTIGRGADGELDGELVDTAKRLVTLPPNEKLTADEIERQMKLLNAVGLTSVRVPGGFRLGEDPMIAWRFLRELRAQERLTVRFGYLMRLYDYSSVDKVRETVAGWGLKDREGDDWLRVGGVKMMVDGGFEGGHMRTPYLEPWGRGGTYKGLQIVPQARFVPVVREMHQQGWRVTTHAVGDAAVDQVLEAYEAAHRDAPLTGRGWAIEHVFIGRPEHWPRMKALDLTVSAQNHLYLAAPSLKKYWGMDRAATVTPVGSMLRAGLPVAGGTDSPVIPYSPWWAIYHFVTRDTISDGVYGASEAISREDALRLFTINAARLMGDEAIKGSIEPGKYADLVVLPSDPITIAPKALEAMKPVATMIGGRFVYRDGLPDAQTGYRAATRWRGWSSRPATGA